VIEEMKAIGKISCPTAITGLLLYSRAMISMLFLGHLGETQLAGGSLSIGFANITGYSVLSGLAMGMEPICGQAYGAKQWKILGENSPSKARFSMIVSMFCGFGLGIFAMLFTILMRNQWGRLFSSDEEILNLTAMVLPIVGLCEIGNCPQTTGCGVLRGSARPTVGANINLGSFYLVGMPVAIILGFIVKMGFVGLWFGLLAAQGSCAVLMLFVLCTTDWNDQVERSKNLTKTTIGSSNSTLITKTVLCHDGDDGDNNNDHRGCLEEIVIITNGDDDVTKTCTRSLERDPLLPNMFVGTELIK
ncbi:multidrug and toxin extrusion protein 1-like, partial [Trifolium pratense]